MMYYLLIETISSNIAMLFLLSWWQNYFTCWRSSYYLFNLKNQHLIDKASHDIW